MAVLYGEFLPHQAKWEVSLRHLFDCIRKTVPRTARGRRPDSDETGTRAHARELIDHLRRAYTAFVVR